MQGIAELWLWGALQVVTHATSADACLATTFRLLMFVSEENRHEGIGDDEPDERIEHGPP